MQPSWLSFVPLHVAQDLAAHPFESPLRRVQRFEAVALFADVSGFTPISEALARSGRAGAEELTVILNSYFEPMIALVQRYGGSVGKFGGDAMTVLFPYDDSTRPQVARRALSCALEMQAAMPNYAAIPTSAGVFGLAMKAGLACGPLLCTSIGDPDQQLEYIIAGGAVDGCAEAEHLAARGEVVVQSALLEDLPDALVIERRGAFACVGGLAQLAAPLPLPTLPRLVAEAEAMLARYVHPAIASRVLSGQAEFVNEHRKVTVLFLRFDGFDYDGDPAVATKLQAYLAALLAVVTRYDGYLSRVDMGDKGSKAIVLFGAPVIHEDDEDRALRCALELAGVPGAEARVGVNSGFVFAGGVGSALRQEYTVMGDPVNLAARLMQAAQAGQVLVGEATRRAAGFGFDWAAPQALTVKGKAEPVSVAVLQGLAAQRDMLPRELNYSLPMVGRQAERARARASIQAARRSQGQVLGITGEAGMGKSRLAADVVQLASGMLLYGGACESYAASSSYLPWNALWHGFFGLDSTQTPIAQIAALEHALAALDPGLLPRMPLLGPLLRLPVADNELTAPLDPPLRAELLRTLLLDCLRRRARMQPLLLLLDDCQWIDALSQELLEYLGRNLYDLPVILLVLYRTPHDTSEPIGWARRLSNFHEIVLRELPEAELRELAALKMGQLFPAAEAAQTLVERVVSRAQGNPFYLEELLSYVRDRGVAPGDTVALEALELPDSLHSLILSRIDQLDEAAKATLKVASVVGRVFRARWLWGSHPQLGDAATVVARLHTLSRLDLTPLDRAEPEPEYLFKHIITHEVAYESMAYATRQGLHEDVAAFVEASYADQEAQYLDVLAYHYGRSANSGKQRLYFRKAGDAAKASYANAAAIDYYERLLPLLEDEEQAATRCALAEIWQLTGKWPEAEQAFRAALAQAEDASEGRVAARCRNGLGLIYANTQSYDEALTWFMQARDAFALLNDQHGLSNVLNNISFAYVEQSEYERALEAAEQLQQIAVEASDQVGLSTALENIGNVWFDRGDYDQALHYHLQAITTADAAGYQRGAALMRIDAAGVYWAQGDFAEALAYLQQGLAIADEIGYLQAIGMLLGNAGLLYWQNGQYDEALRCYTQSLAIAVELDDWPGIPLIVENIGLIFKRNGRLDASELLQQRAISIERSLKLLSHLANNLYNLADLYMDQQRPGEAQTLNDEALELANQVENQEVLFEAGLLDIRLRAALEQITQVEAIEELERLRAAWPEDEQQAAIFHEVWRLDQSQEEAREAAAQCYRNLYAYTPNSEYRQRYAALTGEKLPPPPPLPPLPQVTNGPPVDLDALLARVGIVWGEQNAERRT